MSASFYDLLKYAATGQACPSMTYFDKLRASTLMGGVVQTLTGQPPLSFRADGTPLISWSMLGNGQQSGTPSPQNIIMPDLVGKRTSNLAQWEKGGINITTGADEAYRTAAQGGTCEQMRTLYTPCSGNTSYVLHTNHYPVQTFVSFYDIDKNYISRTSGVVQGENRAFTTLETARYMRAQLAHVTSDQIYPALVENPQFSITLGSTPLPYEPYGYKIPITCAGQTTPVYLGQTQTVRRIKKLVLTGEEEYESTHLDVGLMSLYLSDQVIRTFDRITVMSSHYEKQANVSLWNYVTDKRLCFHSGTADTLLYIRDTTFSTIAGFQQYLRNEYAAGHPVTIWYVLAEPGTAIVNEPLAKIGDYADELHSSDAGVSIPTAKGNNTLTVDTTIQPSEMTITFKG